MFCLLIVIMDHEAVNSLFITFVSRTSGILIKQSFWMKKITKNDRLHFFRWGCLTAPWLDKLQTNLFSFSGKKKNKCGVKDFTKGKGH